MSDNDTTRTTRRATLKYGATAAAGLGLAGCSEFAEQAGSNGTPTGTGSSTVTMEPMGTVAFDSVPETWMAYFSTYGDMGIALGQADGLEALIFSENWPDQLYDSLPGVDVDIPGTRQLMGESGIDKEVFYELECDVHLFDPNFIQVLDDSWTDEDLDDIATNVGPIVGNQIRRRGDDWHDYRYYSLYEAFEIIARVFQERERYEAIKTVHDEFISSLQADLPPEDERPDIGLVSVNSNFEDGSFYTYPIGSEGNGKKQYRDLGINDAFAEEIDGGYAQWDYEQLLEVDPDALVFSYGFSHVSRAEFEDRMEQMRADDVGSRLSAVQNDRLYRGGTAYQGPVLNLLQTEAAAKQFYPDQFGAWNGLETLEDADAQLFDHQRVADIINGDI
ncbi:ABC transporter substrate-binding protein [Haloarcula salinisoli]|uniref:ABC transporter substrate-binding protein n=1 Tax=Haloarcula salinisoli TaxID=2487746 RepID=A0A8J7YK40_9EURY|nr:ABC transporter substrate-binding protein [Halomicroarcula salinisoli]MBX0305118.1 ABC transporter substrate-binding protein [Halomicroarcula salinisoli]